MNKLVRMLSSLLCSSLFQTAEAPQCCPAILPSPVVRRIQCYVCPCFQTSSIRVGAHHHCSRAWNCRYCPRSDPSDRGQKAPVNIKRIAGHGRPRGLHTFGQRSYNMTRGRQELTSQTPSDMVPQVAISPFLCVLPDAITSTTLWASTAGDRHSSCRGRRSPQAHGSTSRHKMPRIRAQMPGAWTSGLQADATVLVAGLHSPGTGPRLRRSNPEPWDTTL